jgi:hypothetical protein
LSHTQLFLREVADAAAVHHFKLFLSVFKIYFLESSVFSFLVVVGGCCCLPPRWKRVEVIRELTAL